MDMPDFLTDPDTWAMLGYLTTALIAGSLIGLERTYHGRPAGFRTHALVCLASALLMLLTTWQWEWLDPSVPLDTVRTDPTRMAQGIMTGIGFLGAGVIFREGLTVRGLTTAASIWITAGIGILIGVGFFFPAITATIMTLGTLSVFRWLEARMPALFYAHHRLTFLPGRGLTETELRELLAGHGFKLFSISYRYGEETPGLEYRMVLQTNTQENLRRLANTLAEMETVKSFRIDPAGD